MSLYLKSTIQSLGIVIATVTSFAIVLSCFGVQELESFTMATSEVKSPLKKKSGCDGSKFELIAGFLR
jgi:hypothetical protein